MANLNKVMLIGNLTADPEVRTTPRGTSLTELRLAVNRVTGGPNDAERREETTFLDVTCWGRLGEIANGFMGRQTEWAEEKSYSHYRGKYATAQWWSRWLPGACSSW